MRVKLKEMSSSMKFIMADNVKAIALYPFGIYFRDVNAKYDDETVNHEIIHWKQQIELFCIFFYVLYILEFVVRFIVSRSTAYKKISFEQEAYSNQKSNMYIYNRTKYAWKKYL